MSEVNDQAVGACIESASKAVRRPCSPVEERLLADEAFLDRLAEVVADKLAYRNGARSSGALRSAVEAIKGLDISRLDR